VGGVLLERVDMPAAEPTDTNNTTNLTTPHTPHNTHTRHDRFSEGQRAAITTAALSPASILTGGPGCGKTFATQAVVQYWRAQGKTVAMCAPTGRAAQRLEEIVGVPDLEASTIHRLLGYKGRHDKASAAAAGEGGAGAGDGADAAAVIGGVGEEGGGELDEELDLGQACQYGKQVCGVCGVVWQGGVGGMYSGGALCWVGLSCAGELHREVQVLQLIQHSRPAP